MPRAPVVNAIPAERFRAFNAALGALMGLPPEASPARVMHEGLLGLGRVVPFDAAWWGETSGGMDGLAPRNWLSGRINLSPQFAREWNRISAADGFALGSIRHLDDVVVSIGYADPVPDVEAFARRHDLHQAMAVTRSLPGRGLLHFVSVYRHLGAARLQPLDRLLFEHYSHHLMRQWHLHLSRLAVPDGPLGEHHGLVDAQGEFVYLGARLALALRERFPESAEGRLPPAWQAAWDRGDAAFKLGAQRVRRQACGDLALLSLAARWRNAPLAPRELSVALMFADGQSHKSIAQATGLSASTVRTYLRDAYLRLDVSDRVALGRALRGVAPPHLRKGARHRAG